MTRAVSSLVLVLAVAFVTSPVQALDATSADNLAQAVLSQLGYSKGVTAIPNCGDGQLARAFVQGSSMKVHAMDSDTARVRQTRELIASIGVTQPNCFVDKGTLTLMPYADRFVDCIVITNLADADLSGLPYAEIERALCPGGKAWVGRATAEGAGITQAALQNWTNAAAKTYSTATVSTTQGTWAVISRSELPGVDTWPRRAYDAAGTRSSRDTVAGFPWLPQARVKPYNHDHGSLVASGGKMYAAFPDHFVPTSKNWVRAYNIYNGEFLWQRDLAQHGITSLTSDFMTAAPWGVYIRGSSTVQLDGNTGAVVTPQTAIPADRPGQAHTSINGGGCGPTSATPKLIMGQMYVFGYDRIAGRNMICHSYKTPCLTGVQVSNGFSIFPSNHCMCNFTPGTMVEAPAGSFTFDRAAAADGSDRIERGPAWGSVTASVVPDAQDWPTYRANSRRSGSSAVNVSAADAPAKLQWNVAPAKNYVTAAASFIYDIYPEQAPTPPVVAGNYTFFGGTDGYVRCIDNTLGQQAWAFPTGGRIYAAPTVAQGCVYVGSGDGWAYCLEAHTGRLVWRFRAAPVDRRFNLFGYLSSTWPVIGGVLVEGNRAYFCGGLQSEYGTHLYCVDALTGALQWQNNSLGTSYIADGRLGFSPEGPMAVANGKLLANSAAAPVGSFNITNGAQDPTPTEFTSNSTYQTGYSFGWASFAREIGVLDNTHMFTGGLWCFSDFFDRMGDWQRGKTFWFHRIDGSGRVVYPQVSIALAAWVCPSWDSQDFFVPTSSSQRLIKASVAAIAAQVDSSIAANSGVVSVDVNFNPAALWTRNGLSFNATVLAPNGLVGVYAKRNLDLMSLLVKPEEVDWFLGMFDRATGATKWEVVLPGIPGGLKGEPLVQGLALDRNGNIVITQRNGNVLYYVKGDVSVASRQLQMPAQPAAGTPSVAGSWTAPAGVSEPVPVSAAPEAGEPPAPVRAASAAPACTVPSLPVAGEVVEMRPRASGPDTSDMITLTNGARYHRYSPEVRALQPKFSPADMTWKPQRQCLPVASARASTSAGKANGSASTLDRDLRTRWSAARKSPAAEQWITYDLGSRHELEAVSIVWHNVSPAPVPFAIAVSADGKTFETTEEGTLRGKGTNTALRTFFPVSARFVRVTFTPAKGAACPSVYEVGIHESAAEPRASAQ